MLLGGFLKKSLDLESVKCNETHITLSDFGLRVSIGYARASKPSLTAAAADAARASGGSPRTADHYFPEVTRGLGRANRRSRQSSKVAPTITTSLENKKSPEVIFTSLLRYFVTSFLTLKADNSVNSGHYSQLTLRNDVTRHFYTTNQIQEVRLQLFNPFKTIKKNHITWYLVK